MCVCQLGLYPGGHPYVYPKTMIGSIKSQSNVPALVTAIAGLVWINWDQLLKANLLPTSSVWYSKFILAHLSPCTQKGPREMLWSWRGAKTTWLLVANQRPGYLLSLNPLTSAPRIGCLQPWHPSLALLNHSQIRIGPKPYPLWPCHLSWALAALQPWYPPSPPLTFASLLGPWHLGTDARKVQGSS